MTTNTVAQRVSPTRTPQQLAALSDRTCRALLTIVRNSWHTQYASQASLLAQFRAAVSAHGGLQADDATLLADFRSHVPLSTYDAYKPFVERFNARPCMEQDVANLLAPGFPDFFAVSSATSGTTPKLFPKYDHNAGLGRSPTRIFDPNSKTPFAGLLCTRNREVKEIERVPGQVTHRIPVCLVTGAMIRRALGWYIDEDSHMTHPLPGYAVPWAATVIGHLPSFLIVHGLFLLARRDLEHIAVPFATLFLDFVCYIDQQWDVLVSCIRDGTLPDLQGIDDIRAHLRARCRADPARAAELLDVGSPFSREGGPFATVLPKVRSILGPNVALRSAGYRASEATIGLAHDATTLDEFVLKSDEIVEFLDVSQGETNESLFQAWEVEVGKQYEPILTTRDGLWRYRLGDILSIIGFDAESGAPVFKYSGRRSLAIRFAHMQITDDQLLAAVQTLNAEPGDTGTLRVQEFTTLIDDRGVPPTVGFLVEVAEPLGPSTQHDPQRLFDALVATNVEHAHSLSRGQMRLPTIRVVQAGTFAEYRRYKGERVGIASGQIKVPLVLVQPDVQAWFLERVVREL